MRAVKTVCVFCASSSKVEPLYVDAARRLGRAVAGAGWRLVFGGGDTGLMREVALAALEAGGRVTGVMTHPVRALGVHALAGIDVIETDTMHGRKAAMTRLADAFAVLPGGLGTLDELFDVMALKLIGVHAKPVVLVNTRGFYDGLLRFFDHVVDERFAPEGSRGLWRVIDEPEELPALLTVRRAEGGET